MGIMTLYKTSRPDSSLFSGITVSFGLPYFTISVSLNVLLTLIIAAWLLLHDRNLKKTVGFHAGIGSIYRSIVTMLVESCALYAVVSICFIVPYAMSHHASAIFLSILARVQIIAPLLIIRRVATQQSLISTSGPSGAVSTVQFGNSSGTSSQNYQLKSIADNKNENDEANVKTTIELLHGTDDPANDPQYDHRV
jgi:hypothetical protein